MGASGQNGGEEVITEKDKAALSGVVASFDGAFVTGSYLVNPDKANDIDVVVPLLAWKLWISETDRYWNVSGVKFTLQESDEDDNYADAENEMYELAEHWRGGGINLLIVRDTFVPAYKAAAVRLSTNPKAYDTREKRVEVHQRMKQIIRDMLESAAMDGDEIPW